MKTQVSVLVKDTIFNRPTTFQKPSVKAYIDTTDTENAANALTLKANKEPYLIDVQPGVHVMLFEDAHAGWKTALRKMTLGAAGFGLGLGASFDAGASLAGEFASLVGKPNVKDNAVQFALEEGQTLRLMVTPTSSGKVKIKVLDN